MAVEVDIAVGQTILTRLGHDQDPQLPDAKEPVITMTTSQDVVAVSTVTKAEVGLAAGGTVPSERRVSRCKLIGFRMALPGKRTGRSRWEKDHGSQLAPKSKLVICSPSMFVVCKLTSGQINMLVRQNLMKVLVKHFRNSAYYLISTAEMPSAIFQSPATCPPISRLRPPMLNPWSLSSPSVSRVSTAHGRAGAARCPSTLYGYWLQNSNGFSWCLVSCAGVWNILWNVVLLTAAATAFVRTVVDHSKILGH